jgi:hypothetical protein
MLNDEVQVVPYSGSGAYGPIYGDTSTVKARIQNSKERTIDDDGNEVVSNTKVFFRPEVSCPIGSKVIADGNTYSVNDLNRYKGLSTESHLEAILL